MEVSIASYSLIVSNLRTKLDEFDTDIDLIYMAGDSMKHHNFSRIAGLYHILRICFMFFFLSNKINANVSIPVSGEVCEVRRGLSRNGQALPMVREAP